MTIAGSACRSAVASPLWAVMVSLAAVWRAAAAVDDPVGGDEQVDRTPPQDATSQPEGGHGHHAGTE